MDDICKQKEMISVLSLQLYCSEILLCVVFICNYLFGCRLEFKDVVLREIFGGEMEKLTGGWREL